MTQPNQLDHAPQPAAQPALRLPPLPQPSGNGALERLGPSPFAKGKVPFLGFLATVYEHLASLAMRQLSTTPPADPTSPADPSNTTVPGPDDPTTGQ